MTPGPRQRRGIEWVDVLFDLRQFEQLRLRGDEQPDRELNRRNWLDEVETLDLLEQLDVPLNRRPRREGHERGGERDAGRTT